MKLRSKIVLTLTILYIAMLFYLSSIPNLAPPEVWLIIFNNIVRPAHYSDYLLLFSPFYPFISRPDKLLHVLLYFGLGLLLFLTLENIYASVSKAAVLAFLLGVLFSAFDEFHQAFVPGRSFNIMDFKANAAGLLFAQVLALIIYAIIFICSFITEAAKDR